MRQLGQDPASAIKDYLGQAEKDGRIVTPMHLDAE